VTAPGTAPAGIPPTTAAPRPSAAPVLRRVVVYGILFVLVLLTAGGLADLLGRLFDVVTGATVVGSDTAGLAVSLSFTLVGGPLAALLGWFAWRRLADRPERESLAWALYAVGMCTVALVVASTALFSALSAAVRGDGATGEAATGLVWAGVWAGHRFVLRRSTRRPTRLPGTAAVLGGVVGLLLGAGGAVSALTALFDTALAGTTDAPIGVPWWWAALQSLVWAAGGGLVWWWHWGREGGRAVRTGLGAVALVGVGILGGCLLTLAGAGTTLFVLLRVAVDRTDPVRVLLDPLGAAIAAALVGGLIWGYHRAVAARRSAAVSGAGVLVTSGVSLVAAASGIGVIVNALLATLTTALAASDPRTLLLAGLSSLVVGGPLWWFTWRPTTAVLPERRRSTGRSAYLVVVFGVSAVVALVALLVIGFRLFDSLLAGEAGLLDRLRAPLGLLVATALVAGYHFSVWRGDRAAIAAAAPAPAPTPAASRGPVTGIGEVVLIMGPGAEPVLRHLRQLTGATVSWWQRADGATVLPDPAQVTSALDGVHGERVVLIVGADGSLSVIPVAGPHTHAG
jgi:hypothetical protein